MANTLKVISALLSYPSQALIDAAPELHKVLAADTNLGKKERDQLDALIDDISSLNVYEAEERYVQLFDRTRTLSLHLFEHVHGESRDRGQAMVDLATMYEAQGFDIDAKELPDYIPLFLEYLSTQSGEEVHNLLDQTLHITSALRERLQKRESIYANALLAIEAIAGTKADPKAVAEILAMPEDDPDDLEAMDEIWEEEAVTFGQGAGEEQCGPDKIRTQLRAYNRRPDQQPNV